MNIKLLSLINVTLCFSSYAQQYVVPPSKSTRQHVPVISDAAMEKCVKLYKEANWLNDKLGMMVVDSYDQDAVAKYNGEIDKHSIMTNKFNKDCAGKQSQSAYEAARKLNSQT